MVQKNINGATNLFVILRRTKYYFILNDNDCNTFNIKKKKNC